MRRFASAFLTTTAIIIVLLNLILIVIYGRQFQACVGRIDQSVCGGGDVSPSTAEIVVTNGVVLLTIALVWWAIRFYFRRSHHRE